MMKICIVIPVYNHHQAILKMIDALQATQMPCIMVNDGSSLECTNVLRKIADRCQDWLILDERNENGGKGAAVKDGLQLAIDKGFSHAIQIDADGQHQLQDINQFIHACTENPDALILGEPMFDESIPKNRLYGRRFTNLWIWINTLSTAIQDGMCGYRCYPLTAVDKLFQRCRLGNRMDFDIEIVVRLYWQGLKIINIPTYVSYPLDGLSHFRMLKDNLLISKKHAQLFFGMLIRLPWLLLRGRP